MDPALQLYTVRSFTEPLDATVRRVDADGFAGVEFAGAVDDVDAEAVRAALDRTGVTPLAAHVDYQTLTGDDLDGVLDHYERLGCRTLVVPHVGADRFWTERRLDAFVAELTALRDRLADRGFELCYHNQGHEFGPLLAGRIGAVVDRVPQPAAWRLAAVAQRGAAPPISDTAFAALVRALAAADVGVEIDTGHVAAAGYDPVAAIRLVGDLGADLHAVHVTDRTLDASDRDEAGVVDRIRRAAAQRGADWLVYEEDDPESGVAALERAAGIVVRQQDPVAVD